MDVTDDGAPTAFGYSLDGSEPQQVLSYDDTVPYEDQVQSEGAPDPLSSLAARIGKGKVYLLADAAGPGGDRAAGKRKAHDELAYGDTDMMAEDSLEDLDPSIRPNALLFTGPPIAHLPTQRIFAYATHFDAHPLGLEWVSDTTCVLIFPSRSDAQKAFKLLRRSPDEEPSIDDGTVCAKSIPVPLWPAEKQLSRTLEKALGHAQAKEKSDLDRKKQEEGLAAPLRMRWARTEDVKKRGARRESEFYKKHGSLAGKEVINGRDIPNLPGAGGSARKRRHPDDEDDEAAQRARLDRELDMFLEEKSEDGEREGSLADRLGGTEDEAMDGDDTPASPPSKMRSDYIASDGRTRVDSRSQGKWERGERVDGGGRRRRGGRGGNSRNGNLSEGYTGLSLRDRIGTALETPGEGGRESKRRRGDHTTNDSSRRGGGRTSRPHKTQEELDAELDAFLNGP